MRKIYCFFSNGSYTEDERDRIMKRLLKLSAFSVVVSSLLGGCAVYGPPPAYAQGGYYESAPGYVVQPAPVYGPAYVAPAPVYAPPVSFGLNFGYWGGGYHHHYH
jgi:hypothetical protein